MIGGAAFAGVQVIDIPCSLGFARNLFALHVDPAAPLHQHHAAFPQPPPAPRGAAAGLRCAGPARVRPGFFHPTPPKGAGRPAVTAAPLDRAVAGGAYPGGTAALAMGAIMSRTTNRYRDRRRPHRGAARARRRRPDRQTRRFHPATRGADVGAAPRADPTRAGAAFLTSRSRLRISRLCRLGDSLTVELSALDRAVLVRIQVPQPSRSRGRPAVLLLPRSASFTPGPVAATLRRPWPRPAPPVRPDFRV
jgi:hypothetical protein